MHRIAGKLERFNRDHGWYYVPVPHSISKKYHAKMDRGLIAITARVKEIQWLTSLLPMGDGSHFIPITQKVRAKYGCEIGDVVEVHFELR